MSHTARSKDDTAEFFASPEELEAHVKTVARLLKSSKHAIVFTGAGLSTGAGIPDFRSGMNTVLPTGPGLWAAQADYERKPKMPMNNNSSQRINEFVIIVKFSKN